MLVYQRVLLFIKHHVCGLYPHSWWLINNNGTLIAARFLGTTPSCQPICQVSPAAESLGLFLMTETYFSL